MINRTMRRSNFVTPPSDILRGPAPARRVSIVFVTSRYGAHIAYGETAPCALLTQDPVSTIIGRGCRGISNCEHGMQVDNQGRAQSRALGFDADREDLRCRQ